MYTLSLYTTPQTVPAQLKSFSPTYLQKTLKFGSIGNALLSCGLFEGGLFPPSFEGKHINCTLRNQLENCGCICLESVFAIATFRHPTQPLLR